jgi:hypothetical protein
MADQTTPRESVRAAFKTILEAADLGVTVYDRLPFEGAEERSVVLTQISGLNRSPGIGLRKSTSKRGLENWYRFQVDCYYDDKTEVSKLADKVEQALMEAIDTLRATYDIHDLRKVADSDSAPAGAAVGTRLARILMEFTFYTHRELTG